MPRIPFFEHGGQLPGEQRIIPGEIRDALAGLLHAEEAGHFIFTGSATDSLNLLIHGFTKKEKNPFHAITTELEHDTLLRPLHTLAGEGPPLRFPLYPLQ